MGLTRFISQEQADGAGCCEFGYIFPCLQREEDSGADGFCQRKNREV
jgi:hypothetical protein